MKNRNLSGADAGRFAEGGPNARSTVFDRLGTPQGVMAALYPYMYQDTVFGLDDFEGLSLDTVLWDSDSDSGAVWTVSNGYAEGSSGTVATHATSLFGAETLQPSKNCGVEIRFQVDVVTSFQMELGIINRLAGTQDEPIISDIDTPAAVALNTGAVFHIDTGETLATGAFALSVNSGSTVSKTNVGTFLPTANNWYTLRIQTVFDDSAGYKAHYYLKDTNAGRQTLVSSGFASISGATAATNKYAPWFLIRTLNTAEKLAKIDYIAKWQDR